MVAGNLPSRVAERDIEYEFRPFGRIIHVWVARRPPGFGACLCTRQCVRQETEMRELGAERLCALLHTLSCMKEMCPGSSSNALVVVQRV